MDSVFGIEKSKAEQCMEYFSQFSCMHEDILNGDEISIKVDIVEEWIVCSNN